VAAGTRGERGRDTEQGAQEGHAEMNGLLGIQYYLFHKLSNCKKEEN